MRPDSSVLAANDSCRDTATLCGGKRPAKRNTGQTDEGIVHTLVIVTYLRLLKSEGKRPRGLFTDICAELGDGEAPKDLIELCL